MTALLALAAVARSDMALEACDLAELTDTAPAPDATGVPTDARPALIWSGSCGLDTPVRVGVAVDGVPTAEITVEFDAFRPIGEGWLVELDLGDLTPNARYELDIAGTSSQPTSFAFTTGDGPSAPPAGAPAVELLGATYARGPYRGDWFAEVELALTPTRPGGVLVVRADGEERDIAAAPGDGPFDALASWRVQDRTPELCVTVVERDLTGTWLGPSEEVCAPAARAGCSHLGGAGLGVGSIAILALTARRRRG